ncbi:MAG: hypothetical protein CYG60_20100 [Actinobacteria bacterium]|jgi:hypothetical protein|nr:hypothetical protein [Actinomycetota bacterium]PLS84030.1 MAG: hypothetical protein CYG60_20100 [Actinomycetota bacterium]
MIEVRPLNPVRTTINSDPLIGRFADSEWWNLIELARRHGFEPPNIQIHFPRPYDHPVELDTEASQGLWEAISAVYNDDVVPYASTWKESNATSSSGRAELPNRPPEEGQVMRESPHEHPELHVGRQAAGAAACGVRADRSRARRH